MLDEPTLTIIIHQFEVFLGKHFHSAKSKSMKDSPDHRGAINDTPKFARRFIEGRLAGFQKDMEICLTPFVSQNQRTATHAYFPALGACCGTLEYLSGLYRGDLRGIGWRQVADWAERFLVQPDYHRECIRILFDAFRHPVAHRGIASGVWVDRSRGESHGRRLTWKLLANHKRPECEVRIEKGELTKDPPWPCTYTHRVHIHLKQLQADIQVSALSYCKAVDEDEHLQENFVACMRQLYPF